MVSPISRPNQRYCPALDRSIAVPQCVSKRVLKLACPLTCPFNPFNPDAPKAFDAIVGRGLAGAARWLEKTVGPAEWARRFDAMDRRFMPERDMPLIAFEAQWTLLDAALRGDGFPEVKAALEGDESSGLRNDARLVFEKLAQSRALLVQVTEANETLPYYVVEEALRPGHEYLYVDFGEQEPLEEGALMFGRFLQHENCLYVIPGVFVGTGDTLPSIIDSLDEFFGESLEGICESMQSMLPEVWNICAALQDEMDGIDRDDPEGGDAPLPEEPYRAELGLVGSKQEAVYALRGNALFEEVDPPEFGIDPMEEAVFDVYVQPSAGRALDPLEDEDFEDASPADDQSVRVGTVYVRGDKLEITALSPVELELLKALVSELVDSAPF